LGSIVLKNGNLADCFYFAKILNPAYENICNFEFQKVSQKSST